MSNVKLCIWGRDFDLPVEYDCYKNETVLKEQTNALKSFIENKKLIEAAKKIVLDYCKEKVATDDRIIHKDNPFTFAVPHYLYVKREEKPRIAIMCNYRYDMEHGLAIVFSSDGKVEVGIQDIIL